MPSKQYAIIDVETTGGRAGRDRITEIAIVRYDGAHIVDAWSSLVNPECYIPQGIVELTGITQEMVAHAPRFFEVAKKVVELTEGAVFVAHNVRFDYGFVCEEFRRLGYVFSRRQLCTVRLSRQVFPGLPSYSLGKLAGSLGIPLYDRHRAMGDASATAEILRLILQKESSHETIDMLVNMGIRESKLPQHFGLEKIHALPEACGVYYLHGEGGEVVYVGKSINIQKRIAEHFAGHNPKAERLQQLVHDVTYELTGSELVALLLESHEIKRLNPLVNRAQRQRSYPFAIHSWQDAQGYLHFGMERVSASTQKGLRIVAAYPQAAHAQGHLYSIREQFGLCAHYCGERGGKGPCFHYHLRQCQGACIGQEAPESYNERASAARERLSTVFEKDFFVFDIGRQPGESAVVLIEQGQYQGYGYLDLEDSPLDPEALRSAIRPLPGNPETNRIVQRFLQKNRHLKTCPTSLA